MKRYRIRIVPKAEEHLAEITAWWRTNRPEHPTLVMEELRAALRVLAVFPDAGLDHRPRRRPRIQKALLKRSRYYVYYRALVDERVVEVLAIWSTRKAKGPPLG
jgi:plasmid stabilization system protein ParE